VRYTANFSAIVAPPYAPARVPISVIPTWTVERKQLADALRNSVPIIITILQKFPFVTKHAGDLPERRYAVIVDEAHSSQSGESAAKMKAVLGGERIRDIARKRAEEEQLPDYEEEIIRVVEGRKQQPNLSFFAFTATPKYKRFRFSDSLTPTASHSRSTSTACAKPSRKVSSSTC